MRDTRKEADVDGKSDQGIISRKKKGIVSRKPRGKGKGKERREEGRDTQVEAENQSIYTIDN